MRRKLVFGGVAAVVVAGIGIGAVGANTTGLDTWKSGKNHNRIIKVQNTGGVQPDSGSRRIGRPTLAGLAQTGGALAARTDATRNSCHVIA